MFRQLINKNFNDSFSQDVILAMYYASLIHLTFAIINFALTSIHLYSRVFILTHILPMLKTFSGGIEM